MNSSNPIKTQHLSLNDLPSGETKFSDENKRTVLKLLENRWKFLNGSGDKNNEPKLMSYNRLECRKTDLFNNADNSARIEILALVEEAGL